MKNIECSTKVPLEKMPTFTCQQMRDFDRYAVETLGIPSIILMENAARSLADAFMTWLPSLPIPDSDPCRVLLLCGKGNNGGDGFALARRLASLNNCRCEVFACASRNSWHGDAEINRRILERMLEEIPDLPLSLFYLENESDEKLLFTKMQSCPVVIDALLGTGVTGAPRAPYDRIISKVNADKKYVFAVDIPSGLNGDSGIAVGEAIHADLTCSLAGLKTGLTEPSARPWVGRLVLGDIGLACR